MKTTAWISSSASPSTRAVGLLLLLLALLPASTAVEYTPDVGGATQNLIDEATKIGAIRTIFVGDVTLVTLEGIEWIPVDLERDETADGNNATSSVLIWETAVNDVVQDSGTIDLFDVDRELPTSIEAGSFVVDKRQKSSVSVRVFMEDSPELATTSSKNYQTYPHTLSLMPLIIILVLAWTTKMVELSLFLGIWLGACILTGTLSDGFTTTLSEFLVGALTNEGHVFIVLFTVSLSGAIGMMQKSGGMLGFTNSVSKIAKTPRAGQFACMGLGILIFFDDYANVLLTGGSMKPLLDVLFVSREKLSFIVDATSAPIASISPISSWAGFEIGLIQDAIDVLKERGGDDNAGLTIPETGFGVFLQSIRYSYYSIFMMGLIAMLIATQRDYGPMLIAERKVRVYDRTDGGPGAVNSGTTEAGTPNKNEPREDQPLLLHNMLIPIVVLIILVFLLLVNTGTVAGEDQSFLEKIEGGDSYTALLYGAMGTAWITIILYLLQITIPGTRTLVWPTPSIVMDMMPWRRSVVEERGDQPPRFLMTIHESVEAFLFGMSRIFLAIVILTLAWGCGSMMTTIGVDRLFSSWITSDLIPYQILPMLTFLIASLMALATGTSWGTMAILFPLILVPTYEAADGDPEIFYATVSAILGGAVAGDQMSPISDTTVLTALACDVDLMSHVNTQAPYVFWVVLFAVLFGYIPAGYSAYPNIVGILLGWLFCALFVYFVCVPILDPAGRWDVFTTLFCGRFKESQELAIDCAKKASSNSHSNSNSNGEILETNDDKEKAVVVESPEAESPDDEVAVDQGDKEVKPVAVSETGSI